MRRVLVAAVAVVLVASYGDAWAGVDETMRSRPAGDTTIQANRTDGRAVMAPPVRGLAAGDWPTYHRTNARDGNSPDLAALSQLSVDWRARLDGAVYGQPLVVNNRIFAATENDTVYALDPDTGTIVWSAHVGSNA
jgi:outer membrane protein assembly factor BamB